MTRFFTLLALLWLGWPGPADAIPVFAHRYGLSCEACHTTVPHLSAFGERFEANGFRLPAPERGTAPLAVKVNLTYSSATDPGGLPKALVDEVELLTGGHAGARLSYFAEAYLVDGGRPGSVRDLWAAYDFSHERETDGTSFLLRAGQFTLPLPVDPETFRETENHYTLYDQTVGANPFSFFDSHLGLEAVAAHGESRLHVLALRGHDKASGLPALGTDLMLAAEHAAGPVELSVYRYAGTRPLGPQTDAFWRFGYRAGFTAGKARASVVLQTGNDTRAEASGAPAHSSGGFAEMRYGFSPALTALARYDGTTDPGGLRRSATFALVRKLRRNSKLTLEDVVQSGRHTLGAGLFFAY